MDGFRHEQSLRLDDAAVHALPQLLVKDAFVERVLVDHDHAVVGLRDQIAVVDLERLGVRPAPRRPCLDSLVRPRPAPNLARPGSFGNVPPGVRRAQVERIGGGFRAGLAGELVGNAWPAIRELAKTVPVTSRPGLRRS